MARTYTNSLSAVAASYPSAVYEPEERLNPSAEYPLRVEPFIVPATGDSEGRYRIALDYAINSMITPVINCGTDSDLPRIPYPSVPGPGEVGVAIVDVPILEFNAARAGESGTIAYHPYASVRTADFENRLQKEIVATQEAVNDKSNAGHTHEISEVNGLDDSLNDLASAVNGKQDFDGDLTALAGLSATGLIARTGTNAAAARTLTGTTNLITVTNGNGVSGNPTVTVGNNVARLDTAQTFTGAKAFGGLTTVNGGFAQKVTNITAAYTVLTTDVFLQVNLNSNYAITLPSLSSVVIGHRYKVFILNGHASNVATLTAASGQFIVSNAYANTYAISGWGGKWFDLLAASATEWLILPGNQW